MIRLTRSYRPENVRVHTVGVGSATNRSLTGAIARAGGGREFQVELDGDPEATVRRLAAQTSAPLVTNLKASGDALTEAVDLPDLMGGSPAVAALRLRPEGGTLVVHGDGPDGSWREVINVSPCEAGAGRDLVRRLVARDLVDRFELAEQRGGEFDEHIERIGLMHRIATRRTSWVAVSEGATVDEREPTKRVKIPQELPYGLSASGLGIVAEERSRLDSEECFKRVAQRPGAELGKTRRLRYGSRDDSAGSESSEPESAERARSRLWESKGGPRSAPPRIRRRTLESSMEPSRAVARFRLRRGRLIVSFAVQCDLEWRPDRTLLNGKHELRLDETRSTRSGPVRCGETIRVVCDGVPDHLKPPDLRTMTFSSAGAPALDLTVELTPE